MSFEEKTTKNLKMIKGNNDVHENNKINYNSFDLAKFICSILVMMIHVAPFGIQENTNIFSHINFVLRNGLCRIAVPLFFIFNGFFLYKKTPLDEFSIQPTKKYLTHILHMYVIWSFVYFPLSLLSMIKNSEGFLFALLIYIKNFILVESHYHLWYLNALIIAVALVSFLLYRKWNSKKILYMSLVFYMFGLLGDGYFGIISPLFGMPFIGLIIRLYFKLFNVTRNGLFFAFFFISLGMVLSDAKISLSAKKSLFLFLASLFMMCIEAFLLKIFNVANGYNVLLFAIPSALFCFLWLKSLNLKDRKIYKHLRTLSSLIFYGHPWVDFIVLHYISLLAQDLKSTPIHFLITLTLTISISLIVMKISNKKQFHWLKEMY